MNSFLPINAQEMKNKGWDAPDFLYITGDAYVDHPSFGHAIISRVLEKHGFRVAILAQPDINNDKEFLQFGTPRLGILVTGGNLDSMVAHYTAAKKPRSDDSYSPGGKAGKRPDRAVIAYCNAVRRVFGSVPIIIGGIEASLRRFAHYDYWQNKVRRSVLFDSRADLLIYGMGEKQIVEIARLMEKGVPIKKIRNVRGTCYIANKNELPDGGIMLNSFEDVTNDKKAYATACRIQYEEQDPIRGKALFQPHGDKVLVQNVPAMPLTQKELDEVYSLNYMRTYHPSYEVLGGVPAINEVKFSLVSNRGCFGACNFCALTFHQGRIISSRSHKSLIEEAKILISDSDFKGYIHDVGGPTADFRRPACDKQLKSGACKNRQCLFPTPCKNLDADHRDYLSLLTKLRSLDGVKKVFVRSGLRFDYMLEDKTEDFFYDLCRHHVSGQLKVAPEHISLNVLKHMGKPDSSVYEKFAEKFTKVNQRLGKKQYLVPYLMSSHPGSTLNDAIELALFLKRNNMNPQQVQDFYPTPGSISTAMFYTGIDPRTGKEVYVPKTPEEKAMQRALLQYKNTDNKKLVIKALRLAGREDLIGYSKDCLVRPIDYMTEKTRKIKMQKNATQNKGGSKNGNNNRRKSSITENKGRFKASGSRAKGKRH